MLLASPAAVTDHCLCCMDSPAGCLARHSAHAAAQNEPTRYILRAGWSAGTAPCSCRAPAFVPDHALGHQQELHLLPQQPEHKPYPESGGSGDVWPRGPHRERPGVLLCQAEGEGEQHTLRWPLLCIVGPLCHQVIPGASRQRRERWEVASPPLALQGLELCTAWRAAKNGKTSCRDLRPF